jgi:glycosyltransferase involved in cell wall biosynthesis
VRIAWVSYLDPFAFSGGGELHNRTLIEEGGRRGHRIQVSAWLRGRAQRIARRTGLHRRLRIDWSADIVVLANLRNHGGRRAPFPRRIVDRALATGRAIVLADAWVDTCELDMPCGGDTSACPPTCSRVWGNRLYGGAAGAVFVSPMQRDMTAAVLDVDLPEHVILSRPQLDPERFSPAPEVERDIDVLYVGHINSAKGYPELAARFGDRLTLVGQNNLGHVPVGNWLGVMPQEELPNLYRRAKHFAHLPSWYEPMGRAVVEAGLCGCDLILNERVGVTSYPESDWRDPARVGRNAERFWCDLEAVAEAIHS